jgi:hypothetical protein
MVVFSGVAIIWSIACAVTLIFGGYMIIQSNANSPK